MDYARPSYPDLYARIMADLAALPAVLRGPLATAWAQACHGQHGHLFWIDQQCSPLTCELERLYDWAALYDVDRLPAVQASGQVYVSGNMGAALLADTKLRGANGLDYTVRAAVTITGGSTPIAAIVCATPGPVGNLPAGAKLTLIDPVPGIASPLEITAPGLTGGAAEESVDAWRHRVAEEWRVVVSRGARSGKDDDYRFWAKSAHPGVTGVLVQRHVLGVGPVLVRPICNALPDRLPTPAIIDAVAAKLQDIAPATADWRVAPPIPRPVDVSLHLAPAIDTAGNRAAVETAIRAAILFEDGESAVLGMAEIDVAIATISSQYTRFAPTADIAVLPGEALTLGNITWI
ncbi:MAG: baseplate J/gp47 family protein [Azonexus sp.]|jgi:uncharacterized phage protein gp47/JayE|nr:baseplate J/gp47 family protein [Azonexus sp.]